MRTNEQLIYTSDSDSPIVMSRRMSSLVAEVVNRGIPVTVASTNNNSVVFDLQADTYCGMYLQEDEDGLVITGKFGFRQPVKTFSDICNVFSEQFFYRSYGSSAWLAQISEPEYNR